MSRSNIDVKSNIYIRNPGTYSPSKDSPEKDEKFTAQIMDADCLRKLQDRAEENSIDLKITESQWQLLVIKPCEYCCTDEMTHGLVRRDGQIMLECRCSVENCPHQTKCGKAPPREDAAPEQDDPFKELAQLGMEISDIFANPEGDSNDITDSEDYAVNAKEIAELMKDKNEYFELSSADVMGSVVSAPLSDIIFLNGTAGAGKTHTAVERLAYILKQSDNQPKILMLCCTDNTANEIKSQIEQKIADGELPESASHIALGTLDFLAVKYLADKGVPLTELRGMSNKERISLFGKRFSAEDFAKFDYCIIDELHEAVDERAQVLLHVLKALKCGCLLLEDKCQAVFDYGTDSGEIMDCTALYAELRKLFPKNAKKFTLLGNKRQSEALDKMTELLRNHLLDEVPAQISAVCRKQLAELPQTLIDDDFKVISTKGTTAILCRKSGDAEYISWLLNKNKIRHTLIRENAAGASLGRYLADILWDWRESTIDRESFVKRFTARCCDDGKKAEEFFAALLGYTDSGSDTIDCGTLADRICTGGELPAVILNARDEMLTISTISRAKGKEFDKVYLLGYDFSPKGSGSSRDEKMFYLAETRPKNDLEILRHSAKWTFRKNEKNRWIRTIREAFKKDSKCVGFGTGSSEDIDYNSFVEGTIGEAVQRQAYISANVKCGDEVYLRVRGEVYEIVHGDTVIGKMSKSYSENLLGEFGGRKYVDKLPERISELFVTNIITFVSLSEATETGVNIPEQFRKKRFWLGVEISGFGTI